MYSTAIDMEEEDEGEGEREDGSVAPLAEGLLTLSMLPKSRWCNLQNLDIIKVCPSLSISILTANLNHRLAEKKQAS